MKKRRNDLRIEDCFLYAIVSPKDLARRLSTAAHDVSVNDLANLSRGSINYKFFKIKGRSIQEPKARLQAIHLRVHRLLSKVAVPDYLHSAVRGRSYLSNAAAHSASLATIKIDIKKFFASVPEDAVMRFLRNRCKCRSDVARLFARILVCNGKISTGSSASPILAYYAFKPMFDEIAALSEKLDLTFTCYVDDMTLSGIEATKATVQLVRNIIARYGLQSHKVRRFAALRPKIVTGTCIAAEGPRVPNKLHLAISHGFAALNSEANPLRKERILKSLIGRLEAAGRIDPSFRARASTLRSSHIAADVAGKLRSFAKGDIR